MFKKVLSVLLSMCLMVSMFAISASADDNTDKSTVFFSVSDGKQYVSGTRSYSVFNDCNLQNGVTWIGGTFSIKANTHAQLIVWLDTIETNIDMGYQYAGTSTFVSGSFGSPVFDSSKGLYRYTCYMTIPASSNYNFFFSNMTAGTLTLHSPTVSF